MKTYSIDQIYNMITTQNFKDFHDGSFEDHITGEEDALSEEEIKHNIEQLLQ